MGLTRHNPNYLVHVIPAAQQLIAMRTLALGVASPEVHQATQRLLAGSPQRSDGRLTVSALAAETQLSRQRLYERHSDLITEFQTKAGGGPIPPSVVALQQQLADARTRIQQLEAREAQLLAQNQTLCAVITELTHEAHADNVITFHSGRSHRT